MSKSVEAHYKGQIVSARDLPTGCQQQCSLVVPTVRAPRHLTEPSAKPPQKQPTKRPERWKVDAVSQHDVSAFTREQRRDSAAVHARRYPALPRSRRRPPPWPGLDRPRDQPLRVSRVVAATYRFAVQYDAP